MKKFISAMFLALFAMCAVSLSADPVVVVEHHDVVVHHHHHHMVHHRHHVIHHDHPVVVVHP
ncbi:MAG TPA: hypothetical protein VK914_04845 [bacterium]|jgi:hypothetical protein|nr:hypothetical protein [bacterium]